MKKTIALVFSYLVVFAPALVFAQTPRTGTTDETTTGGDLGQISETFDKLIGFINNTLIPLVFALALLVFLYGIFKYFILGGGDEGKRAEGRQLMLYSIIGFVVMVSIFGIVNLVANGLGFDRTGSDATLNIPNVPTR